MPGAGKLEKVPSLRGRIVKIGGEPVNQMKVPADARWAVDGDRGVTYSATPPEGSRLVAGQWWPPDYRGPQLVSFDAELARAFGIGVGDTITVNVLGRDIEAKIASLRRIEWQTLSINFVFVFSPGLLDKAPHTFLATVKATPEAEEQIFKDVTDRFPNVTVVRIRDAIQTASRGAGQYRPGGPADRVAEHPGRHPGAGRRHAGDPAAANPRGGGDEGAGRHAGPHRRHLRLGIRRLGPCDRAGRPGRRDGGGLSGGPQSR